MRCVLQDERFAVYDDFLAPPDQARVWRFIQAQRYQGFHARGWNAVWPLHDGEALSSAVVFSARPDEHASGSGQSASGEPALHVYPTGTGIDRLIEELSLAADRLEPLLKAGVPHRITPVLAAAGEHVRCSIAGFFVSCDAPAMPEY